MNRVLLSVEDNDADYYLVAVALKELDVRVQLCRVANGEEALAFLRKTEGHEIAPQPNLILLNINLPGKSGFEVLADIQETESLRSIPVVMFTSSRSSSERRKALELGAADFISKPGTLNGLIETLGSVCMRFLATF